VTYRRQGRPAWVLGILALLAACPVRWAAADEPPVPATPDTLPYVGADWCAEALGRRICGALGWVAAADGGLRLDLTVLEPADDAGSAGTAVAPGTALLARQGRGWTLVTGADGDGIYGAWDREWRAPPAGLAELALAVAALASGDRPGPARRTFTLAADPAATETAAGADRPAGSFRQGLVVRARGGGGPGERVNLRTVAGVDRVRVRSSRRPGWLDVLPRERRPALGASDEVFLPWWPLGDVLTFPSGTGPGTSGPARH